MRSKAKFHWNPLQASAPKKRAVTRATLQPMPSAIKCYHSTMSRSELPTFFSGGFSPSASGATCFCSSALQRFRCCRSAVQCSEQDPTVPLHVYYVCPARAQSDCITFPPNRANITQPRKSIVIRIHEKIQPRSPTIHDHSPSECIHQSGSSSQGTWCARRWDPQAAILQWVDLPTSRIGKQRPQHQDRP